MHGQVWNQSQLKWYDTELYTEASKDGSALYTELSGCLGITYWATLVAQYMALWRFWTNFENLEFEIHENIRENIFLRVVCARKKICFIIYFWGFLGLVWAQTTRRNLNCSMYALCTVGTLSACNSPSTIGTQGWITWDWEAVLLLLEFLRGLLGPPTSFLPMVAAFWVETAPFFIVPPIRVSLSPSLSPSTLYLFNYINYNFMFNYRTQVYLGSDLWVHLSQTN